ncbi:MAG TPA: DUF4342 domain-containing protein [bacterium]|nr:DUF4342 domain-containing protein [bacterium]
MSEQVRIEELEVTGEKLIETVKEIFHGGNIRRIGIRNRDGETVMEFPLTAGVVGALILPRLAALGAIAALAARWTIVVERIVEVGEVAEA